MMTTFRRLRPYAGPYRRALVVGGVMTLAEVGLSLAQPWPLRWVVDKVLQPAQPATHPQLVLAASAITLVVLVLMAGFADYWATRLLSAAGLHVANDLRPEQYTSAEYKAILRKIDIYLIPLMYVCARLFD